MPGRPYRFVAVPVLALLATVCWTAWPTLRGVSRMRRVKAPAAIAVLLALLGAGASASAASNSRRFRSCRPAVGYDIKVSGATCARARRVVDDSFVKSQLIPGTHKLGFTVDGFRCRVTQLGSENKPIPARYRCERGGVVLTWAYHP